MHPQPTVIGITGKIGTGKSTVGEYLSKKGFTIIDCDKIVHELYEAGGAGTEKIQHFFAKTYLTKEGSVNRKKLFKMLLKFPKKWEVINRMIHPLVAAELRKRFQKIATSHVALEIPIYTAKLFRDFLNELWIMESPKEAQYKRLASRNLDPETIDRLNLIQRSDHDPKTIRITNSGTIKELYKKVDERLDTI